MAIVCPRHSFFANAKYQFLAVVGEFEDLVAITVYHPHMSLRVIRVKFDTVREHDIVVPLTPIFNDFAVGVQDQNKVFVSWILDRRCREVAHQIQRCAVRTKN